MRFTAQDELNLKKWVINEIGSMKTDADAKTLANYVYNLLRKDQSTSTLKENCHEELRGFLKDRTGEFVSRLFQDGLRNMQRSPSRSPERRRDPSSSRESSPENHRRRELSDSEERRPRNRSPSPRRFREREGSHSPSPGSRKRRRVDYRSRRNSPPRGRSPSPESPSRSRRDSRSGRGQANDRAPRDRRSARMDRRSESRSPTPSSESDEEDPRRRRRRPSDFADKGSEPRRDDEPYKPRWGGGSRQDTSFRGRGRGRGNPRGMHPTTGFPGMPFPMAWPMMMARGPMGFQMMQNMQSMQQAMNKGHVRKEQHDSGPNKAQDQEGGDEVAASENKRESLDDDGSPMPEDNAPKGEKKPESQNTQWKPPGGFPMGMPFFMPQMGMHQGAQPQPQAAGGSMPRMFPGMWPNAPQMPNQREGDTVDQGPRSRSRSHKESEREEPDENVTTIRVWNLNEPDQDERKLKVHFGYYGKILQTLIRPLQREAFIHYEARSAAEAAVKSKRAIFGNRFIRAGWAKHNPKPEDVQAAAEIQPATPSEAGDAAKDKAGVPNATGKKFRPALAVHQTVWRADGKAPEVSEPLHPKVLAVMRKCQRLEAHLKQKIEKQKATLANLEKEKSMDKHARQILLAQIKSAATHIKHQKEQLAKMKASATALKEKYAAASRSQAAEEGEGEDVPGTPGTPAGGNPDPVERRQSGINSSVNSSLIIDADSETSDDEDDVDFRGE